LSRKTDVKALRRVATVALGLMAVCAMPLAAHPLGNFTINHLAKISASRDTLKVRYILDIAEIPTFQVMHRRANGDWSPAITQRWADSEMPLVASHLHLLINGETVALRPHGAHAKLRPGAGGLPILRWVGELSAALPALSSNQIVVNDDVYADRRIGWKDIVVGSQTEPTDELRHYPSALIGTPRRVDSASFTVAANGRISNVHDVTDATPSIGTLGSWVAPTTLSGMFTRREQTPVFVILTVLAAFGLGALHAAEPGHGKALLAFTLVGSRATSRQALILASSLTFAHTIGVVLLGLGLFFAAGFVSESIYPWITLGSGAVIAIIGARKLARVIGERRVAVHDDAAAGSHRKHAVDDHSHGHAHEHPHSHSHAIPGTQPLNFSSAIWAAMSGGIAPCPAAIVVLLAALRLHQLAYGMVLIVIFSMGLATVLSGLGLGVVKGAAWLSRRSLYARIAPFAPLASAIVISTIGAWMIAQGLNQQGVAAPTLLVAGVAAIAIVAYAFSRGHHHHVAHHGYRARGEMLS
jgi:nickel/cobalt exporter